MLLRRIGPRAFLIVALIASLGVRHFLLSIHPVNGNWVQGAFFGSRLFEFAAGMVLGVWHQRNPSDTERHLFGAPALTAGGILYALGLASYANIVTYVATDALVGCGLFLLLAHLAHDHLAPRPNACAGAGGGLGEHELPPVPAYGLVVVANTRPREAWQEVLQRFWLGSSEQARCMGEPAAELSGPVVPAQRVCRD